MRSKVTPVNNSVAPIQTPDPGELLQLILLLPYPVAYLTASVYNITLANDAQLRLFGLPKEQVLGQQLPQLFPPTYSVELKHAIIQASSQGETVVVSGLNYGSNNTPSNCGLY